MINAATLSSAKLRETIPGTLVRFHEIPGYHLRFNLPQQDDPDDTACLLDITGPQPFGFWYVEACPGYSVLQFPPIVLEVDWETAREFSSARDMSGYAFVYDNECGICSSGPSGTGYAGLAITMSGQRLSGLTPPGGFAFSRWQLSTGEGDAKIVIYSHDTNEA